MSLTVQVNAMGIDSAFGTMRCELSRVEAFQVSS